MSALKCHVCGSESTTEESINEVFEVDGRRVLVEHIPAQVCSRCSEILISRETTERVRVLIRGAGRSVKTVPLEVFDLA